MEIGFEVEYALIAVAYAAEHSKDGLIKARTISKTYDIPHEFFLKVVQKLAKGNVLKSKRGIGGGFCLARPAREISVLETIEAIKPFEQITHLSQQANNAQFAVKMEQVCNEATDKAKSRLRKATLAKMIR
ncbi:MAG: Rrf2 family transcriptional regulator [Deltaproteobacteria bacterium]|nr:Rrf2 family transcriptional regulator [Deltaproteobacteria bacterium]